MLGWTHEEHPESHDCPALRHGHRRAVGVRQRASHCYSNASSHADPDSGLCSHGDGHAHRYSNRHAYSLADTDPHADAECNAHGYADA